MQADTKWSIDPAHSEIAFTVRHLMISNVKGVFREFDADISTTGNDFLTARVDFWMNPASIDTGDKKRDEHLKSAEFFDAGNNKKITFSSGSIERSGKEDHYTLSGNLTMKGITKPVKLDVMFGGTMKDPYGNEKAGLSVTGKINRRDWEITWNSPLETGGLMVSEEVTINGEVQLLKTGKLPSDAKATTSAGNKSVAF